MANILSYLNAPIIWVTPSGMKITQQYVNFDTKRIKSTMIKNNQQPTCYY
jgi:DNA-directed RNA polymerase